MADPEFEALASTGMLPSLYARTKGDAVALYSKRGNRTFADINRAANQTVRALRRAGLKAGDGVAVICANTPELVETFAAKQRGGFRWTPVNTSVCAAEAAYIVENCEAKALFVHADLAHIAWPAAASPHLRIRLAIGGPIEGFEQYKPVLTAEDASDIENPSSGAGMLYTSGTTGLPKGVLREGAFVRPVILREELDIYPSGQPNVNLLCGPGYHGAPLYWDVMFPQMYGAPIVMMEKFDAEDALRLIESHRVTHTHMVSTMFHRLLGLPEEVRRKYDVSSLRWVFHGASADIARNQARDDRMVGAYPVGVFLGDGRPRQLLHRLRGMAQETRQRGQARSGVRCAHTRRQWQGRSQQSDRHDLFLQTIRPTVSPTSTIRRRHDQLIRLAITSRSATWDMSTAMAISSLQADRANASSPMGSTSTRRRSTTSCSSTPPCGTSAPLARQTTSGAKRCGRSCL